MLCKEIDMDEIEILWGIEVWGVRFTSDSFVLSILARWIAETPFMLFFAYIAV